MESRIHFTSVSTNSNHTSTSGSNTVKKILLVEDDKIVQFVHKRMLEQLGFQVDAVNNGEEAFEKTKQEDYTAVLLDLGLPGEKQGEDVIIAIRDREKTTGQHLPIIVNSAHTIEETLQIARDKGADFALMKPVAKGELENCLSSVM